MYIHTCTCAFISVLSYQLRAINMEYLAGGIEKSVMYVYMNNAGDCSLAQPIESLLCYVHFQFIHAHTRKLMQSLISHDMQDVDSAMLRMQGGHTHTYTVSGYIQVYVHVFMGMVGEKRTGHEYSEHGVCHTEGHRHMC